MRGNLMSASATPTAGVMLEEEFIERVRLATQFEDRDDVVLIDNMRLDPFRDFVRRRFASCIVENPYLLGDPDKVMDLLTLYHEYLAHGRQAGVRMEL